MEIHEVLALLETERSELTGVERLTEQILDAPSDDFPELIAKRGDYLTKAVLAENRLKEIMSADEALFAVLNGSAELGTLTAPYRQIFEASLRAKATLCRIKRLEPQVVARMENERAQALSHIEELNHSSASVACPYRAAVRTAVPGRPVGDTVMSV